jgi:hypothetical protein
VLGRRYMLDWLKRRVRIDRSAERRGVQLVYAVFGPGVEDVTPAHHDVEEPPTAA